MKTLDTETPGAPGSDLDRSARLVVAGELVSAITNDLRQPLTALEMNVAAAVRLLETFGAGYISSSYKDAIAFLVILAVLFVMPQGLFGRAGIERV